MHQIGTDWNRLESLGLEQIRVPVRETKVSLTLQYFGFVRVKCVHSNKFMLSCLSSNLGLWLCSQNSGAEVSGLLGRRVKAANIRYRVLRRIRSALFQIQIKLWGHENTLLDLGKGLFNKLWPMPRSLGRACAVLNTFLAHERGGNPILKSGSSTEQRISAISSLTSVCVNCVKMC